jgi:cyclopropane fatty-acyl-phospholipid synthase-like methyltransferase
MENLKDTYNKIAKHWAKDHAQDDWWVKTTDEFLSLLTPGSVILDIGCGPGVKSQYLVGHGFKVEGVDFSEGMINIAKKRLPAEKFHVLDIKDLDSFNEKYNGILAQAVLLHIPKKEIKDTLIKIKDRLNPGGYLYIAVKGKKEDGPEEEIVKENDYGYEYSRFFSFYTIEELRGYFNEIGMQIVKENIEKTGHTVWIQMILKNI